MNVRLTKAISVLCVFAMISVAFSTVVTNVAADKDENDKKIIGSLNPDVATDEYTHIVWQENLTGNFEIYYVNNATGNYENTLRTAISKVECLVGEDDDYEDILEELDEALEDCLERDYKHALDSTHKVVKGLEKAGNTELITSLIDSIRDFAKTNILYAEYNLTFNNTYIQEAYQKYYLAIEKHEQKNYDAAINQFKNSYLKLLEAWWRNRQQAGEMPLIIW